MARKVVLRWRSSYVKSDVTGRSVEVYSGYVVPMIAVSDIAAKSVENQLVVSVSVGLDASTRRVRKDERAIDSVSDVYEPGDLLVVLKRAKP